MSQGVDENFIVQRQACQRLALAMLLSAVTDVCDSLRNPESTAKAKCAAEALEWFDSTEKVAHDHITFYSCMVQVADFFDYDCDETAIEKACNRMAKQVECDPFSIKDSLMSRMDQLERNTKYTAPLRARSEAGYHASRAETAMQL